MANKFDISAEESVDLLVKAALGNGVTDKRQIAYILATAQHETFGFTKPEEIQGKSQAKKLGYHGGTYENKYYGGENFYGRGYVHLTHFENYEQFGKLLGMPGALIKNPDLAKEPELAAKIAVIGIRDGLFTGAKLSKYINENKTDYKNARRTINGTDKADLIADYAKVWEKKVPDLIKKYELSLEPAQGETEQLWPKNLEKLLPDISSLKTQFETHGKQLLLDAGCSEQVADCIIAVGVKRSVERGATSIDGVNIDHAGNRVLVSTNAGQPFAYDAIAASKEGPSQMLAVAANAPKLSEQLQELRNGLDDQLKPLLQQEGIGELLTDKMIAGSVARCAAINAHEIKFAGIDKTHNRLVIETDVPHQTVTVDAIVASKQNSVESYAKAQDQMQTQELGRQQEQLVREYAGMSVGRG